MDGRLDIEFEAKKWLTIKMYLHQRNLKHCLRGIEDSSIESDTGLNAEAIAVKHDLTNEDSSMGMNLSAVNLINEGVY